VETNGFRAPQDNFFAKRTFLVTTPAILRLYVYRKIPIQSLEFHSPTPQFLFLDPIEMNTPVNDQVNISVIALDSEGADSVNSVVRTLGFSLSEFTSVEEFLNSTSLVPPSCIVLCAGSNRDAAVDFQNRIADQHASTASIIVITDIEVRDAVKLMEKGAMTVLTSNYDQAELSDYLTAAVDEDRQCETIRKRVEELESYRKSLSDRQLKILNMVEQGHSNRQIANWFDLSQRTIELERARLMSAFQSASLAQLVSKWTELRVLTRKWHSTDHVDEQPRDNALDA
jgi:FixJ family two-component response regulator